MALSARQEIRSKLMKEQKPPLYISAATNYVNYQDVSADESRRTSEYLKRATQIPYEKALKNHIAYYKKTI